MALATVEIKYPDELRADMQQTYGLNLDGMGVDYSFSHAACLVSQLPSSSRISRTIYPENDWSDETHFLAAIEYDLRVLIWQNTKDGQKGRNKPKPNKTPSDLEKEQQRKNGFDKKLVDMHLGKEVFNG